MTIEDRPVEQRPQRPAPPVTPTIANPDRLPPSPIEAKSKDWEAPVYDHSTGEPVLVSGNTPATRRSVEGQPPRVLPGPVNDRLAADQPRRR